MLEALAFTLFKTYVAFLFTQQLQHQQSLRIEGAPKWYYQTRDEHLCRSGFAIGDLGAIEIAKQNARIALTQTIDAGVKTVIYEHFSEVENPAERELIDRFEKDAVLPQFIDQTAQYHNIEYRDNDNKGFARICIANANLIEYQKQRLDKIRIAVLEKYRDDAFIELEANQTDTHPVDIELEDSELRHKQAPYYEPGQDPFLELERDAELR